jgi:hypothetical protein
MFTNPIRVTSDSCHNVYVIDKHDYSGDRVVVLGQASEVRGIYCGCGKASDFKVVDLVATELDNIIVLDIYSVLHVINSEGIVFSTLTNPILSQLTQLFYLNVN